MSFLSGLSNIFHSIGHVLTGNDDEEQKKKKQQAAPQRATVVQPAANSGQNNVIQASEQERAANPNLNLTPLQKIQPKRGPVQVGSYDPDSPLMKMAAAQANEPPAPVNKNSAGYKLAHNPVTDLVGSVVKPTGELAHAVVEAPHAIAREIQNKPINDIQETVFGTTDQSKILKKIVGDTVNTGLLVAAPGVDNLVAKGASKVLPDATGAALKKVVPKVASGAIQGGAFGANSTAAEGGDMKDIAESAGKNAVIGGAGAGFFAGIPVLAKAVKEGHISPQDANKATKVASGVHTVNPNRPTDAAQQLGLPPEEDPVAPAPAAVSTEPVAEPVVTPPPAVPPVAVKPAPAPAPAVVPQVKPGTTAPNAPGVRAAAQKKLDSLAGNAGDPTTHDVLTNKELLDAGKAHADTFNDTQLVNKYKTGYNPVDASEVAQGHAALQRLNEIAKANPKNKSAAKAIDNILAGAEQGFSKGGRTVNYAQQFYEGLQGPAKTSFLIRQIDKAREAAGKPLLRDDEQAMADATAKVDSHVNAEEANKMKIANLEQRLEEIKQAAKDGGGSKELTKEANVINGAIKQHQLAMSRNTAELAKYYDTVAPVKQGNQQKIGDLGRSLMLSSIAGRGNDIATTGINAAHQLLQQTVEATAGKLVKKPGKVIDTLPSPAAIGRGIKFGLQKSKERFKGNVAAGEASALLKKVDNGSGKGQLLSRSDGSVLSKVVAPIHRVVRSATEIATDLSEGMKESRIQQLASQQGKQAGLRGDDLKSWTAAQTASPSRQLTDAGDRLRDEVNNMQDNQLSDALDNISKGLGKIPVVGEQIRNMVLPFTRWTGGAIHNAITDKNIIANIAQLTKAAAKGDQQGMITAASKMAVNGVGAIGAGYTLAKAGLLTHENAQGYNDDGVYLHVDGRYIPAGFLGFFAPGLIMGSAAHDAMSDPKNKDNLVKTIADGTGKTLANSYHMLGGQSLTGSSNPVLKALMSPSQSGGASGVAATVGGNVTGQYVPAVLGDANAVLNNGIPGIKGSDGLNPTHEAALTKVEKGASGVTTKNGKPSTARDVPRSVANQLLNKIPIASQKLPRNKGVAANDEFDRLVRGSRDTATGLKAKADAKTTAEVAADLMKRGVPDPNATYKQGDSFDNAIENRVENKKYDQAIEGLNAKLAKLKAGPDVTTKQTAPIEKQIKQIQVLKDGKYDPAIRDDYKGVSLSEWRDLGDPTSDNFDQKRYEELFNYDKALAEKGVSASTKDGKTPKYSLKDTSKSQAASARKAAAAAAKKITSNTLGSTPGFATVDLSDLSPRKISSSDTKMPTIQQVQPGELIKKRAISISKTR